MKYQIKTKLKACIKCGERFPEHLINQMSASDEFIDGKKFCPICALFLRNKILGLPDDEPFQGPIAKRYHEEAEEWLENARRGE